jgi:Flp pilus assembly protein TadD
MRGSAIRVIVLGLAAMLSHASAAAEDSRESLGTSRGAFLLRGTGARAVGMGEAFTAIADDATAAAWNPAGLGRLTGISAVATYDAAGQGMAMSNLSAGAPLPYVGGVLGVNLVHMGYGTYQKRDASGNYLGDASPEDMGLTAGWAFRNPGIMPGWTGVAAEVVREASGIILPGASMGLMLPFSPDFCLGAALQHLSPARDGFGLPLLARGGLAISPNEWIRLAADGAYSPTIKETLVGVGVEVTAARILAFRLGTRMVGREQRLGGTDGITAGVGLRLMSFGVDYAYQPFGDLATSHRVSLVYGDSPKRTAFEEAVEPEIDPVEVEYRESVELYRAGRLDAAARKARQVIDADGLNFKGWQMLGTISYAKGDFVAAREYYDKALELNPGNGELREFISRMEKEGAARRKAVVASPVEAPATGAYDAAVALYTASRYSEAEARARQGIAADPADWKCWQVVGNCRYATGDKAGAVEAWRRSLAINPSNRALKAWVDSLK